MTGQATLMIDSYAELFSHLASLQGVLDGLQSQAAPLTAATKALQATGSEDGSLNGLAQMQAGAADYEQALHTGFINIQEFIVGMHKSLVAMKANDVTSAGIAGTAFGHTIQAI